MGLSSEPARPVIPGVSEGSPACNRGIPRHLRLLGMTMSARPVPRARSLCHPAPSSEPARPVIPSVSEGSPADGGIATITWVTIEIAVRRITARVQAIDGAWTDAVFFPHRVGTLGTHWQSLAELLNGVDVSFLPCEIRGATELWNLESIVQVELVEDDRDAEHIELGPYRQAAGLLLITGEVLNGNLVYEASELNSRISDFMNTHAQRFVLLETDERTVYVRTSAIARVQFAARS